MNVSLACSLALIVSCVKFASSQDVCPLGHSRNNDGRCVCCDGLNEIVKCEEDYIHIQGGHCMTWNNESHDVEVNLCLLTRLSNYSVYENYCKSSYKIPTNIAGSELNSVLCGSYNRQGSHCRQCIDGYGPAVFSDSVSCADCSKHKHLWILNLSLQLTAVTLMYLAVILFQMKGTSSPLNFIITYSQLFINGLKYGSALHRRLLCYIGEDLTNTILTIVGFWNLDFFRLFIPPLCVSQSLKAITILLFEYIIAFYPFFLTAFMFMCIKLYDRNCRVVVYLSLPLKKLLKFLSVHWNPKSSILSTFATFFVLAYSKLLYVSVNFLFAIKSYSCNSSRSSTGILLYDPTVRFFHSQHIPYAVLAMFIILIFVILPPLLLLIYPTRVFRRCLSWCGFQRWDILHPIMDIFQGWYKNGTESTRDYRSLSALYMLIRIGFVCMILLLHVRDIKDDDLMEWIGPGIFHLFLGVFFLTVKPYKKQWMNHTDGLCLTVFGCLALVQNYTYRLVCIFTVMILVVLVVVVTTYIVYKCVKSLCNK